MQVPQPFLLLGFFERLLNEAITFRGTTSMDALATFMIVI